jgi:general secretion pathway protein D
VLYELARVSGCTVIKVDRTDNERIGSIVNVDGVSVSEAVTLINVALNDLGYAAIRKGSVLEIHRRADAMTRDIPVMTFTTPYQVPMTDELITAVIPLKSVSATQLQQELRPLMDAGAVVTSDTSANALIITDVTSSIHRIVAIAHQLDLRSTRAIGTRTIELKNARAEDMARMVNDMYKESNRADSTPTANTPPAGAAPANSGRSGRGRGGAPVSQ